MVASVQDLIQGKEVGSADEMRVARALVKYRLRFRYQVPIDGGKRYRGGQVLDFLVFNPTPIPVPVHGEHWHKGYLDAEERLQLARLAQPVVRNCVDQPENCVGSIESRHSFWRLARV